MVGFKNKWLFNFVRVVGNIMAAIFGVGALFNFVMIIAAKFGDVGGPNLSVNELCFILSKCVVLCCLMYICANSRRLRDMN